ncbi:uncharacterized protein V6R79_005479 [Siganus canaliculatus]
MGRKSDLVLLLMLLLCSGGRSDSPNFCPYKCHCFTPGQVLCDGLLNLPSNMSKQVKELIVMTSNLEYLFPLTLKESPQLHRLVFLNNALKSINAHSFEHMVELQELEISGNPRLEHLFLGTFFMQGNLTKLVLNFNSLETVLPGMFDSLKQLETLQLKGNVISQLPALLFLHLHNLRILDLSGNKLHGVKNETFVGVERLEILKMNNNLLSNLTSDAFLRLPQLTELHLEGNKISELADNLFFSLTELKVLNLRGNLLSTFGDRVFGFEPSSLKELNLKGNRLTELSPLVTLASLSDLDLSSNLLSTLPEDIFRNVTSLEYLDLSENQLSSLPETIFTELLSIQVIHLNSNNLSRLEAKLFRDQELIQKLSLSDNRLETLPAGLLEPFAIQHTVRLHGNPWRCDCHLWYLHDWALRNSQSVEMLEKMLCESPGFLRKRPVLSVDRDQLLCPLSRDEMQDLSLCSQEASNGTVTVRCRARKCSPLTVKVQLEEDDGSVQEHVLKMEPEHSACSGDMEIPVQ